MTGGEAFLLSGGEDRAIAVAMLRLCHSGAIGTRRLTLNGDAQSLADGSSCGHRVDKVGPVPADAHDVERAVYEAASTLPLDADLRRRARSSPVLVNMRHRLFDLGLIIHRTPAAEQRWRLLVWSTYATVWVMIAAGLLTSEPDDRSLGVVFPTALQSLAASPRCPPSSARFQPP